jgi:2-oxo-3-hexenedioate decarboxylase
MVDLDDVASELSVARATGALVEPPSRRHPPFSVEDGYAVGRRLALGRAQVGLKLGFTNTAVWRKLGLDSPFWAPMYDDTVTEARDILLDGLVAPRIEPEIVFGFRRNLQPGSSRADICAAVGWAALGFEIVQCHFPSWNFAPADAIADAGLHGRLVVGDRVEVSPQSAADLAAVEVELRRQDEVVATGRGANALGGPVDAIEWLLRLPGVDGLRSGAIVTTGTLTAAFPIEVGESWRLVAAGPVPLGNLGVRFPG